MDACGTYSIYRLKKTSNFSKTKKNGRAVTYACQIMPCAGTMQSLMMFPVCCVKGVSYAHLSHLNSKEMHGYNLLELLIANSKYETSIILYVRYRTTR